MSNLNMPVLVSDGQIRRRLMKFVISDDSSIYVYFPNQKKYLISAENSTAQIRRGTQDVHITESVNAEGMPYISYHPGKNTIHLNMQPNGKYKTDMPPVKMNNSRGDFVIPLCNIMVKKVGFLEPYTPKSNDESPLTIENINYGIKALSVELWIH